MAIFVTWRLRSPRAVWPLVIAVACASVIVPTIAVGQGQDSQTAATGGQALGHPPPLLSSASATAGSSGNAIPGTPLPSRFYRKDENGLSLPPPLAVPRPAQLACDDIHDETARARCQQMGASAAPPKGAAE